MVMEAIALNQAVRMKTLMVTVPSADEGRFGHAAGGSICSTMPTPPRPLTRSWPRRLASSDSFLSASPAVAQPHWPPLVGPIAKGPKPDEYGHGRWPHLRPKPAVAPAPLCSRPLVHTARWLAGPSRL